MTFIGYDDATDQVSCLGTGVIVAVGTHQLVVLTASHGFTEWTDKARPPTPHALRGLSGDNEDLLARLYALLEAYRIRALVVLGGVPQFLTIASINLSPNPRDGDCSIVQLLLPEHLRSPDSATCVPLPIDVDAFPFDEPIILAGFSGVRWRGKDPFIVNQLRQELCVRAGRVAEFAGPQSDVFNCSMYRVSIPTEGGMSGGPMLRLRRPAPASGRLVLPVPTMLATVVGLISRSRIGSPLLLDSCPDGDTWVSPIAAVYPLSIDTAEHGKLRFNDAVRRGWIDTYGETAKRLKVIPAGEGRSRIEYE